MQKNRENRGAGGSDPFFVAVYVDDYSLFKVQLADVDSSVFIASASLASNHARLFGPGEEGATPILAQKKECRLGLHH